ncbi:carbohydrate kinase family protein [Devosia sp. CN2-171]|uniref:carbohydrate kinase family protein n=1 Tax=Devosia sp. CN2-171 TaxID=3400909 RepID=UPI003BF8BCD7
MTAPVLILSNIIIDDLWFADGTNLPNTLGGAATYAAMAARLWWDEVAIVTGVGTDLEEVTKGKLTAYGLRDDGYLRRSPHTIQSKLVYRADGSRTETPAYGPEHFATLQVLPEDIPASLRPAAGTYVFRDLDMPYWQSLKRVRADLGTMLWEIQDDRIADRWAEVAELMPLVDIFSCNLSEARSLFGDIDPALMCDAILAAGAKAVVLRMGGDGAMIATPHQRFCVTPPSTEVVDVTGGGNAFCGGFLAGWLLRSGDPEFAARCAAAGAAHALGQFGPANPVGHRQSRLWAEATGITPIFEGFNEPVR